ncbi:hypothetical protein [Acinetobacter nematophilus]|uniref:Uncharacterized protein n=1 Tax=Acinetobacter nematophilus TaxID=2994642 RepID=A0A9X3IFV1_9GAMM|nr:hypothetical protein [Acinetobacter nematophilus]MCX5467017.1 hypothetical protein [Acinetobacter nematophilus]
MMHSNIVKKISKELAETFIIIRNYLENYLSDLNVKVVNKEEFDYFCTALLFTICSNKLCAVDKKFVFSQFINSTYANIKIDYYSQYFNSQATLFIDDQNIYPVLLAFFDSINTDFNPSSINSMIVILDFKKMMTDIIEILYIS